MSKVKELLKSKILERQYDVLLPSHNMRAIPIRQLTISEDYLLSTSLFTTIGNFSNALYKMFFDTIVDKDYFTQFHPDPFYGFLLSTTLTDTNTIAFGLLQHSYETINLDIRCEVCDKEYAASFKTETLKINNITPIDLTDMMTERIYDIDIDENYKIRIYPSIFTTADYLQTLFFLSTYKPESVAISSLDKLVTDILLTFLGDDVPAAIKHFITKGVYRLQLINKDGDKVEEDIYREKSDVYCKKVSTRNAFKDMIETLALLDYPRVKDFNLWYNENVKLPNISIDNIVTLCQHCSSRNEVFFDPTLYFLRQIFESR